MTTREAPDASISFVEEKNEKGLRPSRIERTSDKPAPNPSSLSKKSPIPFPGYRNRGYIRRKVTTIGSTPRARAPRARAGGGGASPRAGGEGGEKAPGGGEHVFSWRLEEKGLQIVPLGA